jgi:hypothetical protein
MPATAFDDVLNFFVRKGVAHTRQRLDLFTNQDLTTPRTFGTFKDVLGNYHTFKLVNYPAGAPPAFALDSAGNWNALAIPGLASGQAGSNLPFAVAYIQNQLYFANLGYPLWYLDGSATVKSANSPGTCKFLAVNVNHLIQACTIEPPPNTGGTIFPNRVRWSASNNPQQWDPGVDFTAGFNDLLDVPDEITGLSTNGRNTFVWRTNGLTVMFPTGLALAAFDFENFSNSPEGVGNMFPFALSTYDNQTASIAADDLYLFDGNSFAGFGGMNKKKIFADLASAAGDVVWGKTIAGFPGIDFKSYWLTIPGPNITWVFAFESQQWVRFSSSNGYLTALRTVATQ